MLLIIFNITSKPALSWSCADTPLLDCLMILSKDDSIISTFLPSLILGSDNWLFKSITVCGDITALFLLQQSVKTNLPDFLFFIFSLMLTTDLSSNSKKESSTITSSSSIPNSINWSNNASTSACFLIHSSPVLSLNSLDIVLKVLSKDCPNNLWTSKRGKILSIYSIVKSVSVLFW